MSDAPIYTLLPQLAQLFTTNSTVVLQAPPGAGKTTRVPLFLLESEWLAGKSILMLEPRRLAASNAARYMAQLCGEAVGQKIGYSIRYERKHSATTRLEVLTEGILTRRLQNDPELDGVGLVIFDEFHERNLQSDLALALCHDAQTGLRDDLRILIMSATLDAAPLAEKLQAPILTSEGRSHPVKIEYLPGKQQWSLIESCRAAIHRALHERTGDLLVFLPGEAEISRCHQQLANLTDVMVCPLYGKLPFAEQQKAILPAPTRKIVLTTNIAETSLTIEGISVVIDSGYSRQPLFDTGTGITRLKLGRISQASSAQRSGRAGRLGPGHSYRLWSEGLQQALLPFTPPEIRAADLAPLALDLLAWGVKEPGQLFWLDPPSPTAWQQGLKLLELLGLIDQHQQLNDIGTRVAKLPVHPRLGRLLIAAKEQHLLGLGCDLVALLSEPDPWFTKTANKQSDSDLLDRLEAYWRHPHSKEFSAIARACRYWRRYFKFNGPAESATTEQLATLLATAYPDRIGKPRQPGSKNYLLSSGQGALLGNKSALQFPDFLIAVDMRSKNSGEAEISLANAVTAETLCKLFPQLPWQQHCFWDAKEGRVITCEQQRIGELVINQRQGKAPQADIQQAVLSAVRSEGLQLLDINKQTQAFCQRLRFLHSQFPQDWPDVSEQSLLNSLEDWLLPFLGDSRNRNDLKKIDLLTAIRSQLDWHQLQQLEKLAPEKLAVPSGSKISLQYPLDNPPVLAVKLQEMFGQNDSPKVAGGQVPVVIHLLSPAGRPLQITQDLRHFWEQSYPEVQKEMKGRYPKHPWPDDPTNAQPTAKTKRKLAQQEE
ncbi:ATP-dependent helicase HrpB [Malonomonas rubra]|uniref:ATP-dependent helicase HrpB n=1 Tax=Malonomonas rubra TaxID=57040 RepID=UPI0026F2C991|nr:ATP-dependent helicase HrpB [Malonomonas rubra]